MLVLDLGISRVGGPEGRYGRAEQALPDVSRPVRFFGVEPPRVVLHDRRHRRQIAAQPRLQILVQDPRLEWRTSAWTIRDEWWDRRLRAAVAELNNCWLVWWEPSWEAPPGPGRKLIYGISGRPRDLDSYMYSIVVRQRTVAWNGYKSN